jgi:tRNA(fMet)-specific endonuclease VapC
MEIKEATATSYAKTRLSLKKKGKPIPENDLWIASICIESNIPLISNDSHFEHIDSLKLKSP